MSNQQTRKRPSLTTWILISLVAGIVVGLLISAVSPEGSLFDQYVTEGLFYVLGQWFIRLMQMLVIPLVFCSIVCGAAAMADPKLLGKVGIGTLLMYIITTALAVLIAIGLAQLVVAGGIGGGLSAVQQTPAGQQHGAGAQGGQPNIPLGGLLDELGDRFTVPQVLHAHAAAGQHDHLRLVQIHLGQLQFGLDGNVVSPGDGGAGQGDQRGLQPALPQQIGGDDGLGLLKAGGQQYIYHG